MASNILSSMLIFIQGKADTSGFTKTDTAIRKTAQNVRSARKEMSLFGKVNKELTRGLSRMVLGGVGIWGAINAGGRYLQFEKDLGAIHSRFYAITKDEQKASEEFNYIRKLATDTALDIKSTADSYSIFYSATQKALGTEGARGVFENWTKVGRVLHLSEYQMERVTYALREMASKGAIYSQDLRMQIGTHVPNAMGLAQESAEQMGITGSDWFEKLQEKAKGNTKITTEFVRRFSANAEKMFGSPQALQKAMQQPDALAKMISNIGYNFMVDFSKAGGSYMIVKILSGISKALTSIDYTKLANTLGSIAHVIGNIFTYIPQIFEVLKLFKANVEDVLKHGYNVWVDATFLSPKSREWVVELAKKYDAEIYAYAFKRSLETCLKWNSHREGRSFVPESAIRKMYDQFEIPGVREGFDAIVLFGEGGQYESL